MTLVDILAAAFPTSARNAGPTSACAIPRKYNHGNTASTAWARRTYAGTHCDTNGRPRLQLRLIHKIRLYLWLLPGPRLSGGRNAGARHKREYGRRPVPVDQ